MRMRLVMLAAVLSMDVVSATNAFAQQPDCKSIQDPKARLACFDGAAKAPKATAKKAAPKAQDEFAAAKQAMLRKLTDPESARWGDFYSATDPAANGLVCGAVNSKNQMGGYVGMTGFVYWPRQDRAILLLSGRSDPDYTYAAVVHYCRYCVSNPRADKSIQSHCDSERSQIDRYPN
jgi:hypothetical protein